MVVKNSFLIVDDDYISRYINEKVIKQVLKDATVYSVESGIEALQFLYKSSQDTSTLPNYILVDINMPFMDGFEFIENFKKLNLDRRLIKIIILSSSEHPKDLEKAKALGVFSYLIKPLSSHSIATFYPN